MEKLQQYMHSSYNCRQVLRGQITSGHATRCLKPWEYLITGKKVIKSPSIVFIFILLRSYVGRLTNAHTDTYKASNLYIV